LGSLALTSLLNRENHAQEKNPTVHRGLPALPHFMPRAKRVIYLFQSGGPAQMDLYDYKPELKKRSMGLNPKRPIHKHIWPRFTRYHFQIDKLLFVQILESHHLGHVCQFVTRFYNVSRHSFP